MTKTASSPDAPGAELTKMFLVEAIMTVLRSYKVPVPRVIVAKGVDLAVDAAGEIDLEVVKDALGNLPIGKPLVLVDDVWDVFTRRAAADEDGQCEVKCPESGDIITLEQGPGLYTCPDCKQELEVEDGVAYHPLLVFCPATDKEVWAHYEEETYDCPECGLEIVVADGEAKHQRAPRASRTGKKKPHRRTFK